MFFRLVCLVKGKNFMSVYDERKSEIINLLEVFRLAQVVLAGIVPNWLADKFLTVRKEWFLE
jgi:hypothetical protein